MRVPVPGVHVRFYPRARSTAVASVDPDSRGGRLPTRALAPSTPRPRRTPVVLRILLALGIPLLLSPISTVGAQEVTERITPGKMVRITAPTLTTDRLVGKVVSVDSVGISLMFMRDTEGFAYYHEGDEGRVPFEKSSLMVPWATMQHVELGQRKWSGMRMALGASIGMVGGAISGGLLGLAADDPNSELYGYGAFVGGIVFGGLGLVLGTIIGALPHEQWQQLPLGRPDEELISLGGWSSDLSLGYAQDLGDNASSGSVSAVLNGIYSSGSLGLGVEGAYHGLGTVKTSYETSSQSVLQATMAFRMQRPNGEFRPYGALGVGAYFIRTRYEHAHGTSSDVLEQTDTLPGINVGVGAVHNHTFGPLSLGFHARWHAAMDGTSFFTISALARIGL